MAIDSKPFLSGFNPNVIPYQMEVINDVRENFDYENHSYHEILLSGSYGSAKSILCAHIAVSHCLMYPHSCVMLTRLAMPDLKETIFKEVLAHISEDLVEGVDYTKNTTSASVTFLKNNSKIMSRSFKDNQYGKFRSLRLSMIIYEEMTECDNQAPYDAMKARLNRVVEMNGKENCLIVATNPDSPGHWAYKYFHLGDEENRPLTRHVYYSVTSDNPFLPASYTDQLLQDLDPLMARRMIGGEWIEISGEVVYYAYDQEHNRRKQEYKVDHRHPVRVCFDFNIAEGKPMSAAVAQYIDGTYHIFEEAVVEGMRTADTMEELAGKGIFDMGLPVIIHGDATGRHKDTRSLRSDYDIIRNFLSNYLDHKGRMVNFDIEVPRANPPIRKRHNLVNAACVNAAGQRSLFVYNGAKVTDEGLRLTKLKSGGNYIEDDSKAYQHITTAIGYMICRVKLGDNKKRQGSRAL